jgi:hypothetical protein
MKHLKQFPEPVICSRKYQWNKGCLGSGVNFALQPQTSHWMSVHLLSKRWHYLLIVLGSIKWQCVWSYLHSDCTEQLLDKLLLLVSWDTTLLSSLQDGYLRSAFEKHGTEETRRPERLLVANRRPTRPKPTAALPMGPAGSHSAQWRELHPKTTTSAHPLSKTNGPLGLLTSSWLPQMLSDPRSFSSYRQNKIMYLHNSFKSKRRFCSWLPSSLQPGLIDVTEKALELFNGIVSWSRKYCRIDRIGVAYAHLQIWKIRLGKTKPVIQAFA